MRTPEKKNFMDRCPNVLRMDDCEYEQWDESCMGDTCDEHSTYECGQKVFANYAEYMGWHAINYTVYCRDCVNKRFPEGIFYIGTKKIHLEKQ